MSRPSTILLASIVGGALLLRLWGISFGLPYDLTADEPHQIIQALRIGADGGGPLLRIWHTVGKGGLDYLLFFEYGVLFVFWRLVGRVATARDFALAYLADPTAFYMVGRITVAVVGAATSAVVFQAGRRIHDARIGLGAALLSAVAYFHSASSHLINVHIPMTFTLWSGVAVYLGYETSGRRRALVAAGLLCGAAVALAYSAAIGLLMVLCALLCLPRRAADWATRLKDAGILIGAALVAIAAISPDLLWGAGLLLRNFIPGVVTTEPSTIRGAIDSVTILPSRDRLGFLQLMVKPDTVLVTLGALAGAVAGCRRREPWIMLLAGTTVVALATLSASNRGISEAYLLPVMPAVWILSSRGIAALSLDRRWLNATGILAVGAVSLFFTVRDDFMLTKPDTRVLAKAWIEQHVPSGSKILMDGMRFRYVQGVPLNGNEHVLERRIADLEHSELALSGLMLSLYREGAGRVEGPTYDLYSTVYGLEVEDLDHYVRSGFTYVVVSSFNEKRYDNESAKREHPKSARFYRDIRSDPRFRVAYTIGPEMWKQVGPTITVYRVVAGDPPVQWAAAAEGRER